MSDINLIILTEQQTKFDQKINNIQQQRNHLNQLYPIHKQNLQNPNQEKKDRPKLIQLPTAKDLKMANHFDKVAKRVTDFTKAYF